MTGRQGRFGQPRARRGGTAAVVFLLLATPACGIIENDTVEFVVRVDSITVAGEVLLTQPLTVRFWGRVGPDLCSRVVRVERHRGEGVLEMRFIGERDDRSRIDDAVPANKVTDLLRTWSGWSGCERANGFRVKVLDVADLVVRECGELLLPSTPG